MRNANRFFTLAKRPAGVAGPEHFTEQVAPVRAPGDGEVLLETLYVSVDPAMRVWISENPGYVPRVEIGDVMRAAGIALVVESRAEGFSPGDVVQARVGWQTFPTLMASEVEKLDAGLGAPEDFLCTLGMTGLTAYFGLHDVGRLRPGETVLVSGAAGGVGQMVGQIAGIDACRVVGIAGGAEKCRFLTGELGFAAAIDYKAEEDFSRSIAAACPRGVDVFYDNVGGAMLDAALANLKVGGRVVICGRISQTASESLYGVRNLGQLIGKRARVQGFVVTDYAARFAEARHWLSAQARSGRLRQRLHVLEGFERCPEGLAMLFRGGNTGKLVVKVAG